MYCGEKMREIFEIFEKENLIYAVLSNKRNASVEFDKVTLSPFLKGDNVVYQFECFKDKKALHKNYDEFTRYLTDILPSYKNLSLFTDCGDYQILIGKKGNVNIKRSKPTKKLAVKQHNKAKNYYFKDGTKYDFLVKLGIMTEDGKVKPTRYNKFVQINKYIEIVGSSIDSLNLNNEVRIVDFGCGKAYLTFSLYHYLVKEKQLNVRIFGEDVIKECSILAENLGYNGLEFISGDIADFDGSNIDIAVSLHACDIATDIAIIKAVEWGSKLIIAVPCCHHELFDMIENKALKPVLQYGVLKDKFASVVTDAMRGLALQINGYDVNIMEFTPIENTPKNILIKAVKTDRVNNAALNQYKEMKNMLNINPYIDNIVKDV